MLKTALYFDLPDWYKTKLKISLYKYLNVVQLDFGLCKLLKFGQIQFIYKLKEK